MNKWTGVIVVCGLLMLSMGTVALAQEEPATPQGTPDDDQPAVIEELAEGEGKRQLRLYLSVAGGFASSNVINTSIAANSGTESQGEFELTDLLFARAAIGWKFPENKGSIRAVFKGFKEDDYTYGGPGVGARNCNGLLPCSESGPAGALGSTNVAIQVGFDGVIGDNPTTIVADEPIPWWFVNVQNGVMTAQQFRPLFTLTEFEFDGPGNCIGVIKQGDDRFDAGDEALNCNGIPELVEVRYDFDNPDQEIESPVPDDLQNQIQTVDLLYGREFGGRRYSSNWFVGVRYFAYEGHLPATAWLVPSTFTPAGAGFSNGAFFPMLVIHQETSGWGPTGNWEVDFNFHDRGLQLFLLGQVAFTFNSMEMDSGPFTQFVNDELFADRMTKSLRKSQWQNSFELGGRINFKNGLTLEAGYGINAYLDIILSPDLLQIGIVNSNSQTTTQDFIFDTVFLGAAYQFGPGS